MENGVKRKLSFESLNVFYLLLISSLTTFSLKLAIMKAWAITLLAFIGVVAVKAQSPNPIINYDDYENLVKEVKKHRQARLLSLNDFLKKSKEKNVIILDARSDEMYKSRHLVGARHLNFSDFTQGNLERLIPDKSAVILIYCNNNFSNDDFNFASKVALPTKPKAKPITLALNIPTYINLYGYGYKNVYELSELIPVNDARLQFEGVGK
jgi:hypothetical protein